MIREGTRGSGGRFLKGIKFNFLNKRPSKGIKSLKFNLLKPINKVLLHVIAGCLQALHIYKHV